MGTFSHVVGCTIHNWGLVEPRNSRGFSQWTAFTSLCRFFYSGKLNSPKCLFHPFSKLETSSGVLASFIIHWRFSILYHTLTSGGQTEHEPSSGELLPTCKHSTTLSTYHGRKLRGWKHGQGVVCLQRTVSLLMTPFFSPMLCNGGCINPFMEKPAALGRC